MFGGFYFVCFVFLRKTFINNTFILILILALIEVKSIDDNGVVTLRGLHAKLYVCVGEKGKVRAQVRT